MFDGPVNLNHSHGCAGDCGTHVLPGCRVADMLTAASRGIHPLDIAAALNARELHLGGPGIAVRLHVVEHPIWTPPNGATP